MTLEAIIPIGARTRMVAIADPPVLAPEPEIPDADEAPNAGLLQFSSNHGACMATWAAPIHVAMELDRFADDRDELTAEVIVRYTAPGLERQLVQRRANLLSTRGPADLAKVLTSKIRDLDWPELLEQAFTRAIHAHREGEPAVLLPDVPRRIGSLYEIEPLALRRMLTVEFSRPGEGKTWMAAAIACALSTGRADILGFQPTRTLRVLFLDWEQDEHVMAERVRAIAGEPVPGIVYLACRGAIWDELDRITRVIRQHDIEYLLIDSLGMACGGVPPETSEAALRFGTAFRRLGLGGFAAAHLPHDAKDESRPFGSVFWNAQARLTWFVKREQELGDSGFKLGLFNKKANNDRPAAPIGYELRFDDGRVTFHRCDVRDSPGLASHLSLKQQIFAALRDGGMSPDMLAETIDKDKKQVGARLSELVRAGKLRKMPDGNVWLAERSA